MFNGLLSEICAARRTSIDGLLRHTQGGNDAACRRRGADRSLRSPGSTRPSAAAFYDLWLRHRKGRAPSFSQGVNQSTTGTDKVNAILNCHLATGRIGGPGVGRTQVTGQPNAMGGREVGGLANMLACHLDLENAAHRAAVRDFWEASRLPDRRPA